MNIAVLACLVLSFTLVSSCSSGQASPPAKGPAQPSWAGMWTKVDGLAIPPEKRIRLTQSCNNSPEYWTIEQKGSTILLDLHEARHASGIERAVERHKLEKARGQLRNSFARLDGETGVEEIGDNKSVRRSPKFPVTYELQYEPKTEHLAGTRNGAPVRFVRAELQPVDYSRCQPVP